MARIRGLNNVTIEPTDFYSTESLPYTEDKSIELRHMSDHKLVILQDVSFQNGRHRPVRHPESR